MSIRRKILLRRIGTGCVIMFFLINLVAALHAWRFTHFTDSSALHDEHPEKMSLAQKASILLTGVPNARPVNKSLPIVPYQNVVLQSNVKLACWYMPADGMSRGSVALLHGYGGEKSGMLPKAMFFHELGYNVLLPDMMGAGGSESVQCTIGYREAENVSSCVRYLKGLGERNIILHGTSMGAAALLKYLHDGGEQPAGIIIECPYGTMYQTVCARFKMVGAPSFPMAALLVFWGGVENGFWAFNHNPATYAKSVKCPALLIFGAKDDRVTRSETEDIYRNLAGTKRLVVYPEAGHNNYFIRYKKEWMNDVTSFIHSLK